MFRIGVTRDFADGGLLPGLLDQPLNDVVGPETGVEWAFLPSYSDVIQPEQIDGFDAVITGYPLWTRESFAGADRLLGVAYWGVGYDDVDIEAATEAGVVVSITTPAVRRPMAESIVAFMLALSKNLVIKDRLAREGRDEEKANYNGILIKDRVVGAIGVGNIGAAVVEMLRPFGPSRVLAFDPYLDEAGAAALGISLTDMDTVLRESDFVTVMCPLNDSTRGLLGAREFGLMKKSAFFINCARGGIVDQAALTKALQDNAIRGAALDVFAVEPPSVDDPLLHLENVIVAPHCIGWTDELYYENGAEDCRAALRLSEGLPPAYVVNPDVLNQPVTQRKLAAAKERRQA